MNSKEPAYQYYAFISYSSKDTRWGRKLQRKLEGYRIPSTLRSEHRWERKPIRPVFFAPTDIQPGELTEELRKRLRESKHLIVICSPNSARSEWVGKEIAYFHSLGRTKNIHFFIIDGVPHSGNPDTECFNPVINELEIPEILGANINEKVSWMAWLNKERAYIQLITKLLGIEFDALWQRHKRWMVQKVSCLLLCIITVLVTILGVWKTNQPVDVKVMLREASVPNTSLPPLTNARVLMIYDNDTITKRTASVNDDLWFNRLPASMIGKEVRINIIDSLGLYCKVDTVLHISKEFTIGIRRDPKKYGYVKFRLLDAQTYQPIENCEVEIEGQSAISDSNGNILITIPLERQRTEYEIHSSVLLEDNTCLGEFDADGFIVFVKSWQKKSGSQEL